MNRKVSAWWRRTTGTAFALGLLAVAGLPLQGAWAQGAQGEAAPRMRVIIDNDFSGDPDGLFQLAHHLLSPSVEVRGIIGSHVKGFGGDAAGTATAACRKVGELLEAMGLEGRYRVCEGSNRGMDAPDVPAPVGRGPADSGGGDAERHGHTFIYSMRCQPDHGGLCLADGGENEPLNQYNHETFILIHQPDRRPASGLVRRSG